MNIEMQMTLWGYNQEQVLGKLFLNKLELLIKVQRILQMHIFLSGLILI